MTPDVIAMYGQTNTNLGTGFAILALVLAIVDAVLKAIALRTAAQKKHKIRFVCLFIFNTAGILPLIYLLVFAKKGEKKADQAVEKAIKTVEKQAEKIIDQVFDSLSVGDSITLDFVLDSINIFNCSKPSIRTYL